MKIFNLLVIVLLILAGCNKPASYKVSGTIAGLDSGEVYLVKAEAGQAVVLDTSAIKEGQFTFKGEAGAPELHYLRINQRDYFAPFFLENENIKVEAFKDSLQASKISGSPATDVYNEYVDELKRLNQKVRELQQAYSRAMSSGNEDEMEQAKIEFEASSENMLVYAKNFVREHSNSVVAPFIALTQLSERVEYPDLKELVDGFSAELDSSIYVKELKKMLDAKGKTAVGVEAPDFTLNDPDGNPVSLSSFRGKYLMIDFWASWCMPCRQENPNVVKMYSEFKDKGFEIIGVSLDREKDPWVGAIKEDHLTWAQVWDTPANQNEVARLYNVTQIPHTVLIDPQGKIIAKNLRGPDLEKKLKELLP